MMFSQWVVRRMVYLSVTRIRPVEKGLPYIIENKVDYNITNMKQEHRFSGEHFNFSEYNSQSVALISLNILVFSVHAIP